MNGQCDIVLIQTSTRDRRMIKHPPLGLLHIAALPYEKGAKIKILDGNFLSKKNIQQIIIESRPKIIGFTTFTGLMLKDCIELSRFAKKYTDATIVWGGIHATLLGFEVIKEDYVDIVCLNEGDYTLYEILLNIGSLERVKGIIYKNGGRIVQTEEKSPIPDLDILPAMPWKLIDLERYVGPWADAKRTLPIITSRGCTGECTFCYNNINQYRSYSSDRIKAEVDRLISLVRLDGVRFDLTDDFIGSNPSIAIEIAHHMKRLNLKWSCDIRLVHANEQILRIFKECGCRYILIGVESGSDKILKFVRKHQTRDHIVKVFNLLNKLKIRCCASIMFDFPSETESDLNQTFSLMKKLRSYLAPLPTQVYPKTGLYDYCIENNIQRFPADTLGWSEYNYEHVHHFSDIRNIEKFIRWRMLYFTYIHNLKVAFLTRDWFTLKLLTPKVIKDTLFF